MLLIKDPQTVFFCFKNITATNGLRKDLLAKHVLHVSAIENHPASISGFLKTSSVSIIYCLEKPLHIIIRTNIDIWIMESTS